MSLFTFEVRRGWVSNKQDMQTISGQMNRGRGHIKTKHKSAFTIDGKPALLNGSAGLYFSNEDEIIATGQTTSDGVFHIANFKNLSSGVIQHGSTVIPALMGGCCLFIGVWTYFLVITPILFIPLGMFGLLGAFKAMQANKYLDAELTNQKLNQSVLP
ncbi:hypothetical protein NBRC116592_29980 [Colwellia sp. KU-HH00111]|uniref:hypothetical protein n=1 Tax=Colwellia sp. KU-HH00111 TaxID=3127652 RepID=UPI0031053243